MLSELLSRELLHPVFVFPRRDTGVDTAMSAAYGAFTAELPCELHLVNMRWMPRFNNDIGDTAVILHHAGTDCNYPAARFTCPLSNGEVCTIVAWFYLLHSIIFSFFVHYYKQRV